MANGFNRISEGLLQDTTTVDALEQRQDLGAKAYAGFGMRLGLASRQATFFGITPLAKSARTILQNWPACSHAA